MKANEAPEKIYIQPSVIEQLPYQNIVYIKPLADNSIEYTRTDAFIEKACELLARMIWEVTYEDLEGNSVQHYDKMEFIKDFCKAMKGE